VSLALLGALLLVRVQGVPSGEPERPRPLSAFQVAKAEALLRDRLPCLGCHEVGGEGGRIGPGLSELKRSRTQALVAAMIRDPERVVPGTIMPRVPMPRGTRELIAAYLVQREPTGAAPVRPSPPAARRAADTARDEDAARYARLCAACHGTGGGGDGYNARFLPVRPTAHADSAYMSARSDDALFDAIFAGGYVMNRSNRMPPYGQTLSRDEIRGLVRYMRTLCRCFGPAWSRDNQ
jgi:mono/diheme cytochrome c family protein